ncbi:diguanylate cyclase domain-containing protein [Aliidiomarina sp.]|uniref:GGDEF domain-containing protein n=1 Tax=Aliidiomarina sp. TaxID=1872439 RepID=UPI003A4D2278
MNKAVVSLFLISFLAASLLGAVNAEPENEMHEQSSVVEESKAATAVAEIDIALEEQLEATLGMGFVPNDLETFQRILNSVDNTTPVETWVRVHGYEVLRLVINENDLEGALKLAESVRERAEASNNANAITEINTIIGEAYIQRDRNDEAHLIVPTIQQQLAQVTNPRIQYHASHLIARTLMHFGEFAEALEYMLQAHAVISVTDNANTQRRRQFLNLHIARLQSNLGNYRASIDTANATIDDSIRHGLTDRLPEIYLIRAYAKQYLYGPSEEQLAAFLEAAESAKQVGDKRVEMLAYNNAGATELLMNNYANAQVYLEQGIAMAKRIGNVNERSVTEFNLGYIKVLQGNYEEGLAEMETAAEVFKSFALPREVSIILSHLANAYELAGEYQLQAATLKEKTDIQEELFQTERDNVISELQVRYEAEEKSLQIQILEQQTKLQQQQLEGQKRQQFFMVLTAFLLFVIIILTGLAYRHSNKINTLLNKANRKLHIQSFHDPLTGLYNRRAIHDFFLADRREANHSHGIYLIDIDYFKRINDQHGHDVGDTVLVEMGNRLKSCLRENDLVIRWGGEEFLIVIKRIQAEQLAEFADKITHEISKQPIAGVEISVSGGGTLYTHSDASNWEATLKQIDQLLYQSKNTGRGEITVA